LKSNFLEYIIWIFYDLLGFCFGEWDAEEPLNSVSRPAAMTHFFRCTYM